MAKDDMSLLMFKILSYLYECNRNCKIPTLTDMYKALELDDIYVSYFIQILEELIDEGYIKGVLITRTKGGPAIAVADTAKITHKGVQFLNENSRMKKAAEFAGKAFEFLLSNIISLAIPK